MADEIDWDDYDELAADRAAYRLTRDPSWLPVIAELERKLGLPPSHLEREVPPRTSSDEETEDEEESE